MVRLFVQELQRLLNPDNNDTKYVHELTRRVKRVITRASVRLDMYSSHEYCLETHHESFTTPIPNSMQRAQLPHPFVQLFHTCMQKTDCAQITLHAPPPPEAALVRMISPHATISALCSLVGVVPPTTALCKETATEHCINHPVVGA